MINRPNYLMMKTSRKGGEKRDRVSVAIVENVSGCNPTRSHHPPVLKRSWSLQDHYCSWDITPPPCMSNRAHYVLMTAKHGQDVNCEPSLGGGSLSRSHRGVPPPSDHHLPPPRGNQSVVGLPAEPWFHKMDRRQADMALKGKAENGCFMIRPSRTTNPYTLSLIYDGQSYHIGVRQRPDGQFALGSEKYNEQKFPSVEALVENYRREHLVLYSHGDRTGCTRLTVTPSRNPSNL